MPVQLSIINNSLQKGFHQRGMMSGGDIVVVADGVGQEVFGIAWGIETDCQLCAAEVGSGLVADELAFGNEEPGQVTGELAQGYGPFGDIAADADSDT